jgi:hypothetical protein
MSEIVSNPRGIMPLRPLCSMLLLAMAVTGLSGCFRYRAAQLTSIPEGGQVRVSLTRQGFAALSEIPLESGPRLSGTLVSKSDAELRLRVPVDRFNDTAAQEFVIPANSIVSFETRELSRGRTAIAVTGGLATAIALYLTFEKGNPFSRENSEDPENEEPGVRPRRFVGLSIRFW